MKDSSVGPAGARPVRAVQDVVGSAPRGDALLREPEVGRRGRPQVVRIEERVAGQGVGSLPFGCRIRPAADIIIIWSEILHQFKIHRGILF